MKVKVADKFKDELSFIYRWIDVYSAIAKPRSEWLSNRRIEFYAITVYLYSKGYDLTGKSISDKYKEMGNFNNDNGEVSNYRKWLVDNGWLIPTRKGFKPIDAFINFKDKIVLNYTQEIGR